MNGLNPDLLFQRMAGGALRGVAESEDILMRRCNGVMENGRRCSVVPIPGHEYCKACEAKEARGEMPALAVVKLPVEPLRAHNLKPKKPAVKTVISDNKLSETTAEKPPMSDADFNAFSEMLYQSACGDDTEAIIQAPGPGYQDGFQIPTIASTPPPEQVTPCIKLSSPLAAVLVKLPPPVPPLSDTSVVIEFPREMFDDLVDKGVGTDTIKELLYVLFISGTHGLIRHAAE